MRYNAGPYGVRAHLFINNPLASKYPSGTTTSGYDVLTDDDGNYSVPYTRRHIYDGDVAVVYRVEPNATLREPGNIVAVARITSSPWMMTADDARVYWTLRKLQRRAWISSADMRSSKLWDDKVPFSSNGQVANPVEQDLQRWHWLSSRLPKATLTWLDAYAKQFAT